MSGINGDKSRFNRVRKQRIAQRQRNRELFQKMGQPQKPAATRSGSQPAPHPKTVSE
jgi:hypothetical protein